jgi:hypothetical protein
VEVNHGACVRRYIKYEFAMWSTDLFLMDKIYLFLIFYHDYLPPYTLTGFDLTTYNSAGTDHTTRPRHFYLVI